MKIVQPVRARPKKDASHLVRRLSAALLDAYPGAFDGNEQAVHDARVVARRLRSALRLLAAAPQGKRAKRADRALRDIARALSRGRDLDVGIEILGSSPTRGDWKGLLRALRSARARARASSKRALAAIDDSRLARDLRGLAATARGDRDEVEARIAAIRARDEGRIARVLAAARRPGADALHRARRAARRLRYAAELSDRVTGLDSGTALPWNEMQKSLGRIQDRHVLSSWLSALRVRARDRGDAALASAAAEALRRVKQESTDLVREFSAAHRPPRSHPTAWT